MANDALWINHEGGAFGNAQKGEHTVFPRDLLFRIAQQRECEAKLFSKAAIILRLVHADAQNLSAGAFKIGKTILVCLQFLRSARRVGVNKESQDNTAFPMEIAQPTLPACVVRQFKIRRRVSNVQCHPGFP